MPRAKHVLESPDQFIYLSSTGKEYVDWDDGGQPFGWYRGNLVSGNEGETHYDLWQSCRLHDRNTEKEVKNIPSGLEDGALYAPRRALFPSGRFWKDQKLISFWVREQDLSIRQFMELMAKIGNGSDLTDWKVEFAGEYSNYHKRTASDLLSSPKASMASDEQSGNSEEEARDLELAKQQHLVPIVKQLNKAGAGSVRAANSASAAGYDSVARFQSDRRNESMALATFMLEGMNARKTVAYASRRVPTNVYSGEEVPDPDKGLQAIIGRFNALDIDITDDGEITKLEHLQAEKTAPKGSGTAFMQALSDWADQNGRLLVLQTASKGNLGREKYKSTSSGSRLKKFYSRFGFVSNYGKRTYRPDLPGNMHRALGESDSSAEAIYRVARHS